MDGREMDPDGIRAKIAQEERLTPEARGLGVGSMARVISIPITERQGIGGGVVRIHTLEDTTTLVEDDKGGLYRTQADWLHPLPEDTDNKVGEEQRWMLAAGVFVVAVLLIYLRAR